MLVHMQSKAATVEEYLATLPADRRATIDALRKVILANVDRAHVDEGMAYGMIGYAIPHRVYPGGYHCNPAQPLPYAGLAAQKNAISLYLCGLYTGHTAGTKEAAYLRWFVEAWTKSGKKLDMGKSCIRFKKLDDVPLEVVGEALRRFPAKDYLAYYQSVIDPRTGRPKSTKKSASKSPATAKKKAAPKSASKARATTSSRKKAAKRA